MKTKRDKGRRTEPAAPGDKQDESVIDLPDREAMSLMAPSLGTLPGLGDSSGLLGGSGMPAGADAVQHHLNSVQPQNSIVDQNTLSPGAISGSSATQDAPIVQP